MTDVNLKAGLRQSCVMVCNTVDTSKVDDKRFCRNCGKTIIKKKPQNVFCDRKCFGESLKKLRGDKHRWWRGGRKLHSDYILIYKPDHPHCNSEGYIREHRLVYEEHHKCSLLPWAKVHHINRNAQDNKIENLELMTQSKHAVLHQMGRRHSYETILKMRISALRRWANYVM